MEAAPSAGGHRRGAGGGTCGSSIGHHNEEAENGSKEGEEDVQEMREFSLKLNMCSKRAGSAVVAGIGGFSRRSSK
jgi:hypothetical protein